jgi:hypothetical protein
MINKIQSEIKALENDIDKLYIEFNKHYINEDDLQYNLELIDKQLNELYDELYIEREALK